ncbi:unnamed protein product [Closterium sp. Yama58-4]|nr:unnamed protein product [Closterium sp. Yama58-4]
MAKESLWQLNCREKLPELLENKLRVQNLSGDEAYEASMRKHFRLMLEQIIGVDFRALAQVIHWRYYTHTSCPSVQDESCPFCSSKVWDTTAACSLIVNSGSKTKSTMHPPLQAPVAVRYTCAKGHFYSAESVCYIDRGREVASGPVVAEGGRAVDEGREEGTLESMEDGEHDEGAAISDPANHPATATSATGAPSAAGSHAPAAAPLADPLAAPPAAIRATAATAIADLHAVSDHFTENVRRDKLGRGKIGTTGTTAARTAGSTTGARTNRTTATRTTETTAARTTETTAARTTATTVTVPLASPAPLPPTSPSPLTPALPPRFPLLILSPMRVPLEVSIGHVCVHACSHESTWEAGLVMVVVHVEDKAPQDNAEKHELGEQGRSRLDGRFS